MIKIKKGKGESVLGEDRERVLKEMSKNATSLYNQGKYEQALNITIQICDLTRKQLGEEHPDFVARLNDIAFLYELMGKYGDSEAIHQQAMEIIRKSLGKDHPDFAASLNNLAGLYESMGEYEYSKKLYLKAIEIRRRILGEDHQDVSTSLNNLAVLHEKMGNYEDAESLYIRVIEIDRKTIGEEHLDSATCLENLARLYKSMGHYTKAEPLCCQVMNIMRKTFGEDHPEFAISLTNLAELYRLMGNYGEAEKLCRQAVGIQHKILGEEHPDFETSLYTLGDLYYSMKKYEKAEPLYQQAIEITRKILGEDHPEFAISLHNLADLYRLLGNYEKAEPLYQQAMEITRKTLGEEHSNFATSLKNLIVLYESMGNYALENYGNVEPLYRQAVETNRKIPGKDPSTLITSLHNLARLYESIGNYADAEPLYQEVVEIERKVLGENHTYFAASLHNLAGLYESMGRYPESEALYLQAIKITRKSFGEDDPDFATCLHDLAYLYNSMGKYSEAKPLYLQAMEIRRKTLGEEHPDYATSLGNLAALYESMGNYIDAEQLYQQSMDIQRKIFGEHHSHFASSLNNLAVLYKSMEYYAKAEPLFLQAIEIDRKIFGEEHPDFAASINNLAGLYKSMGNYEASEPLYQQAIEITRKILGEEHPDFATCLNNLAVLHESLGNYTEAEKLYRQSMEIWRKTLGEDHPDYATSINNLVNILAITHREDEAYELILEEVGIDDRMISQIFSIGSERQRLEYLKEIKFKMDSALSFLLHYYSTTYSAKKEAMDLILRRKAISAEALSAQRDAVLTGKYPELKEQLEKLTFLRMEIAKKALAGPGPEGIETHRKLLSQWNTQKDELESKLARKIPEMKLEYQFKNVNLKTTSDKLPIGYTLIEFVRIDILDLEAVPASGEPIWKPPHYIAFTVPAGKPDDVQMFDLGEAKIIDQYITKFRNSITGEEEDFLAKRQGGLIGTALPDQNQDIGYVLRKTLFDPLLPAIGNSSKLLIAPDGNISILPFEVLPADSGVRLIDQYHISYLSVGRDVLRFDSECTSKPSTPLIIADPDFDLKFDGEFVQTEIPLFPIDLSSQRKLKELDEGNISFTRLPGTKLEGEHIGNMLGIEPWMGKEALEAKLKSFSSPHILHIATHGFFLKDQKNDPNKEMLNLRAFEKSSRKNANKLCGTDLQNPMLRSGIALAGANTWLNRGLLPPEAEDGIFTAEDVSGLDLLATELVVLSACDTGLGKIQIGEGVFGLRRAFMLAGAKSLIMSLWKVPDRQTRELMEDFYRRVLSGQARAEALREAQLAIKEKYPDPLYWGAFICQGDPGPIKFDLK